jgi:hypothetical protein
VRGLECQFESFEFDGFPVLKIILLVLHSSAKMVFSMRVRKSEFEDFARGSCVTCRWMIVFNT